MTADDVIRIAREAGIAVSPSLHMREAAVAAFFDVGVRTVQQWRTDGTGPPWSRLGGGVFYPCEGIADHVNEMNAAAARRKPPNLR